MGRKRNPSNPPAAAAPSGTSKLFRCPVCNKKTFKSRRELHDHQVANHEKSMFKCELCGKLITRRLSLMAHLKLHYQKDATIHKCDKCPKEFLRKSDLAKHILTHLGDEANKFMCKQCQRGFKTRVALERHMCTHSYTGDKPYQCAKCLESFSAYIDLRRHQRTVECASKPPPKTDLNEQSYICEPCDFKFKTQDGLQAHCQRIHSN